VEDQLEGYGMRFAALKARRRSTADTFGRRLSGPVARSNTRRDLTIEFGNWLVAQSRSRPRE
jgi:hypothetical protein